MLLLQYILAQKALIHILQTTLVLKKDYCDKLKKIVNPVPLYCLHTILIQMREKIIYMYLHFTSVQYPLYTLTIPIIHSPSCRGTWTHRPEHPSECFPRTTNTEERKLLLLFKETGRQKKGKRFDTTITYAELENQNMAVKTRPY